MADEVEVAATKEVVTTETAVTEIPITEQTETAEEHPALSLLEKIEAKLFFVETEIATEIKQVIDEIKSHF